MDDMLEPLGDAIEKNLLKAIGRLTTDLVNIPIRTIERRDAEKTAESNARIAVTQTVAQRVSEDLNVSDEFVTLAATKFFGKIVQEQLNIDDIVKEAQLSLQNTPQEETNTESQTREISDDWLNRFRESACQKSSEEAQDLFSKVLAGEIRKPGSFSLLALTTLANMDQNVATIFNRFCSLCIVHLDEPRMYHLSQSKSHFKIKDARIPLLLGDTNELSTIRTVPINKDTNTYTLSNFATVSESIYNNFGLRFSEFQLLLEYSLIESSSSSKYNCFYYNNEFWGYTKQDSAFKQPQDYSENITISGYALTSVGKELFHITERQTLPQYWELLSEYLENYYKINLYKIPKRKKKSSSDEPTDQNTSNT